MLSKFKDQSVSVYGLGKRGVSLINALSKAGADVAAWDERSALRDSFDHKSARLVDFAQDGFGASAYFIITTRIKADNSVLVRAQASDLKILSGLELFRQTYPNIKILAVLGANGKSTTTSLIEKMYRDQGRDINREDIEEGTFWSLKVNDTPETVLVMDVRSDQLSFTPSLNADTAMVLNIFKAPPNGYLDMDAYLDDVKKVFGQTQDGKNKIIAIDSDEDLQIYEAQKQASPHKTYGISFGRDIDQGLLIKSGAMFWRHQDREEDQKILSFQDVKYLKGRHNWQNIAAAFLAAKLNGLEEPALIETILNFEGLPYRQFLSRVINGVSYVNDAKAQNPVSTKVALKAFEKSYWIGGGQASEAEETGLENYADKISHAFLIGSTKAALEKFCLASGIEYTSCENLEEAVKAAHLMAQSNRGAPGGSNTVLYSPAYEPEPPYNTPEESGAVFDQLVQNLSEEVS